MRIGFISDFFSDDLVGGAENNDAVLIKFLKEKFEVKTFRSFGLKTNQLLEIDFFIISNFTGLPLEVMDFIETREYIIYEHDHKYVSTRDPSRFPNFCIPEDKIINKDFYVNAKFVIVLSEVCKAVLEDNLKIKNVVNIGTSLWSEESLSILERNSNKDKNNKFCIIQSNNPIKGQKLAEQWCKRSGKEYDLIKSDDYENFISSLSTYSGIVFIPGVLETFSRLICESKILGLKVVTNKNLIGFASESHFGLSQADLLEETRGRIDKALQTFLECIETNLKKDYIAVLSLWRRGKWLEEQIDSISRQTVKPREIWLCHGKNKENENLIDSKTRALFDRIEVLEDGGSIYSRFEMCEENDGLYYFIIDDDMFPNENYISNCFKMLRHHDDAIICSSGRIFIGDTYFPNKMLGSVKHSNSSEVDMGTNGWFLSYESIKQMNDNHDKRYNNGEDIALSYLNRQNRGVKSYVIKQNNLVNSDYHLHKRGVGEEALSHASNHKEFYKQRNEMLMNYKKRKFGLSMTEAKSYWDARAKQKKEAAVGFISNSIEKQDVEYDEKISFVTSFIDKNSSMSIRTMDYGCGIGRYSRHFSNYLGVDMTEELIKIASSKSPDKNFLVVDSAFGIPDEVECERVFTATVLQHNDDTGVDVFFESCKKIRDLKEFILYENSQVNCAHMNARDQDYYKKMLSKHFSVELVSFDKHVVHGEEHTISLFRVAK